MTNKKKNTIITFVIVGLILIVGIIIFLLNYQSDDKSLTILEKKWVTDNTNKIVDVNVYNDVPVYGYNGSGLIFDYLSYFTEKYQINFNKISYYAKKATNNEEISFLLLKNNEKITDNDILLYQDHYVVLSKNTNDRIDLNDISSVGILTEDSEIIKSYLPKESMVQEYENINELLEGIDNQTVSYAILPNMLNMDIILSNNLNIVYHITDLKENYVLRIKDDIIYSIMNKSYLEYKEEEYQEDYSNQYLTLYFESTKTTDLQQKNYNAKTYKYGYVINMPYENNTSNNFVGTISNYLHGFEKIADVEIEVIRYDTIDDLKSALVSGEVDFALGNFDYNNINMKSTTTSSISSLEYIILSKRDIAINSLKGLQDEKISVVASSALHQLCKENNITTTTFHNTDELLRSLDDYSIVLLDKQTYLYYKDNKLKDYQIIYENRKTNGYKFLLNANNEPFNSLFRYYIGCIDYNTIRYQYNTNVTLDKDYTIIKIIIFLITLIAFLVSTIFLLNRKNITNTTISKEDKLKFIDPMTSLKNRNYLNANIYKWDDNVIFPQSVVVLDINGIKEINDKLGREAGDEVIKKVASVLINNQLENTDIIRSGGDEFLTYMIGYEEKKVVEYTKKLIKEMKNIPNSLGIEVGYSMILDEVKTVDDAINEAIIMLTKNKEKKK